MSSFVKVELSLIFMTFYLISNYPMPLRANLFLRILIIVSIYLNSRPPEINLSSSFHTGVILLDSLKKAIEAAASLFKSN